MAKRSKHDQTKHDRGVKASAEYYRRQGYKVDADIEGYRQPESFNGRRPDVVARKGQDRVLLEVETKSSLESDRAQQDAFRRYANSHKRTRFRRKLVK